MNHSEWVTANCPAAIIASHGEHLALTPINLRLSGEHRKVYDILRHDRTALCGCLDCGKTWDEGALLPSCIRHG